ncbi:hypothetical protein [Desulfitobacterium sp. AusDCA]|uniref:hypothetical protein n=1 Tax=Desulfitobacterium sp. AusDCA TaxID=3240383 RepID=UPI003DA6D1CB
MSRILLIEPNYKNKYPPLGLMKLAYFHKNILNDYVLFTKGKLPEAQSQSKWDHIYVTSLFTFEWARTIEAVKYALTLVDSPDQITVGGIAATLMSDQMYADTGIRPVRGLLNERGKLGLPGDECIDQIIPDYSILDDIASQYVYPFHDAYFLSATKGCGMKCGFCAVQTLEPTYVQYINIREKIMALDRAFGPKRDLLLMDNNVLRSTRFDDIIDDIIEAGFERGAIYTNPKTGKQVHRYVDFNQGLDANLLTPEKARRLGEIALRPARIAFDHIEDKETYERAIRLCAENGIIELSNYMLYNSEDFSGKGKQYEADTPKNLYDRMRATLDLKDSINMDLPEGHHVKIFSFPMRYIPLSDRERGYVGSRWSPKFLRAIQCMMIPTQGKGVGNRSFFEADFGKNSDEFERFLCMPEKLIASRGDFMLGGRGRTGETAEQSLLRKEKWEVNQKRLKEWSRLFDLLKDDQKEFEDFISNNEFLPQKLLGLRTVTQKKLYLHYLTEPRILALLGKLEKNSPTRTTVTTYIRDEFSVMYEGLVALIASSEVQQQYMIINFLGCFGEQGLRDLLYILASNDFDADKQMAIWSRAFSKQTDLKTDFELIRLYRRFVMLEVLSKFDHSSAHDAIVHGNLGELGSILYKNLNGFKNKIMEFSEREQGVNIIANASRRILDSIQLRLSDIEGRQLWAK